MSKPEPCAAPGHYCPPGALSDTQYPRPAGRYSRTPGADPLCASACPAGSFCPLGAAAPLPCPGGTLGALPSLSTSQCSGLCSAGFYCPPGSTSAQACPALTTSSPGAASAADCWRARLWDPSGALPSAAGAESQTIVVWPSARLSLAPSVTATLSLSIVANCDPGDTLALGAQSCTCGGAILGAPAAALASATLRTSPSNGLPAGAPRVVRFALQPSGSGAPPVHADIAVAVAPRNDAPAAVGLRAAPGGSSAWRLALPEGAPAEVLVVVAVNCSALPQQLGGGGASATPAALLCFEDPDPLLGRAATSGALTDTYLGAAGNGSAAAAASDAGAALAQVSRYALSATATGASAGCAQRLQLLPVGSALWDCAALSAGSASWLQAQATAPVNASSPLQPHAPFGLAPSLRNATQRSPCWAQRHRLVLFSSAAAAAAAASALPDDGCGTWSASATCGLDFEAAYCGRPAGSSWQLQISLNDTLTLDGAATASTPRTLDIEVQDVPEAPVLAWADGATLAALALPPLAHPGQPSTQAAVVDDATALAVNATGAVAYAPLLLCTQCAAPGNASVVRPLPLEGAAALPSAPPFTSAAALFSLQALSPAVLLSAAATPACAAALRSPSSSPSAASVADPAAQWQAGMPSFYVQAFALVGRSAAGLMLTPTRAFTLLVDAPACSSPRATAASASPLAVPVRLTRANRQVAWNASQPPPPLTLTEHALPGAATDGVLEVLDADAEQDVSFSVASVRLVSCGGSPPSPPAAFTPTPGLFVPLPLPRAVSVLDAATGRSATVNATRKLRLGVGVDALDLGDAVAACVPSLSAAAAVASCEFEVTVVAQDSGDSTASHSLLPLQPPTAASAAFRLTVLRDPATQVPGVGAVLGLPPAGLSAQNGTLLQLQGVGLMLPAGPLAQVVMRVYGSSSENFMRMLLIRFKETE